MSSKLLNCKTYFEIAYNQRYTWPDNFKGYKGSCLYSNNQASYHGEFSVNEKLTGPNIVNQSKPIPIELLILLLSSIEES